MRDSLVLYECPLCHTFLENNTKAISHLGIKHSEACRKNCSGDGGEDGGDFIKSNEFPEPVISLERLTLEEMERIHKESPTPIVPTSKPRVNKRTPGRLEIKLDTLKAGEIEMLVTDLFSALTASSSGSGQGIRRSGRKVKDHLKSYGELDSDDEEIIRTGSGRRIAHKKIEKDPNYDDSDFEDDDFDDDVDCGQDEGNECRNLSNSKIRVSSLSKSKDRMIVTKNHWCGICDVQFDKVPSFQKHMIKEHLKDGTYTCNSCGKQKVLLKEFSRHLKTHVIRPPKEECKICGKVINCVNMVDHMKMHKKASAEDPNKPNVCPVCHHRFRDKHKLQQHFILHLENNPFKCEFLGCGKKCSSNLDLQRHIATHTDRIIYKCNVCPAQFSRPHRLKNHVAKFHSENSTKVYKAKIISNGKYRVKTIHELVSSIKKPGAHQPDEEDDLESVHLTDRIITTEDQDIHIKGEKLSPQKRQPVSSTSASRSRRASPSVEAEINQHRNKASKIPETPMDLGSIIWSDPIVKRLQETNPESLNSLKESFNVKKPPQEKCKVCGKVLNRLSMAHHMKIHEKTSAEDPNKPHVCPVCQYRFDNKSKLQRHFILHLENNPFKCNFLGCGTTFTNNPGLQRHIALHTDRVIHQCNLCPAQFSRDQHLKKHVADFHSENSKKVYKGRLSSNGKYSVKSIHELVPSIEIPGADQQDDKNEIRFDLESVHLADRIITTEDQDIHIKGEKLSPQPVSSTPASRSRSSSPPVQAEINQHRSKASKIPETPMELVNIVRSDPVVKRLQETNPESLKYVIGSGYKYNRHSLKGDFKCQICSWTGTKASSFKQHMQNSHGATTPATRTSLVDTTPDSPIVLELMCGSCGYRSNSADDLSAHISKSHAQKNKFPCSFCRMRFPNISRRKVHERKVHLTEKKFKCTKCDAKYSSSTGLSKHVLKHDPEYQKTLEKTCKCKKCGRVFANKYIYLRHYRLHTNPAKYRASCKICGQNCANNEVLRRHIQYVHAGVKNPYLASMKSSRAQEIKTKSGAVLSTSQTQNETPQNSQNKITTGEHNPNTSPPPPVQPTELNNIPSNIVPQDNLNPNDLQETDNQVAESIEILGF